MGVFGLAAVAWGVWAWWTFGQPMHDLHAYALTGERLNSGGRIYDLRPFDPMPAGDDRRFPLYGPPTIAVPWRLLAALPNPWGNLIWALAMTVSMLAAIVYVYVGTAGWAGLPIVAALWLPIGVELGIANVDSAILCAVLTAYALRDRSRVLGLLIGAIVVVKLTPIVLLAWLIGTRRWSALATACATILVLMAVTAAITEPAIWIRYVDVAIEVVSIGRPAALLVGAVGVIAVIVVARIAAPVSFALAVLLIPLGSPQAGVHSWTMALGCLAPVIAHRSAIVERLRLGLRPAAST